MRRNSSGLLISFLLALGSFVRSSDLTLGPVPPQVKLGRWLREQRKRKRNGILAPDRDRKLQSLEDFKGVTWDQSMMNRASAAGGTSTGGSGGSSSSRSNPAPANKVATNSTGSSGTSASISASADQSLNAGEKSMADSKGKKLAEEGEDEMDGDDADSCDEGLVEGSAPARTAPAVLALRY